MHYIIDGHNLIPHVRGLSLSDMDDESGLLCRLEGFRKQQRAKIDVFFDQAAIGHAGKSRYGMLQVHSVARTSTADQAIVSLVRKMGKAARQVIVVTSDRQVQANARACAAQVMGSEEFAQLLLEAQMTAQPTNEDEPQPKNPEVDYWLEQFRGRKKS